MGKGGPTTILESGWGTPSTSWHEIQPRLAKVTRVCVFDRAGYGFSDPGLLPRDSAAAVADLHNALKAAGLGGPYVLVGHSLAGFDARLYAYTFPDEVAGLLLLDPPTENIYRRDRKPDEDLAAIRACIVIAKSRPIEPQDHCGPAPGSGWSDVEIGWLTRLSFLETLLSEDESMVTVSADELASARHGLGDLPLIVLQADASPEDERSKELAGMARDSSRGVYRIVPASRHYIYRDKPDAVVAALGEILAAARIPRAP
jgi:pimeloyl-ACP methyl ester carboxylesterase